VIDWNDLKWFLAVAEVGSFRAAASATGLNHTTLSRRIRGLEESLGTSLLERAPTGLTLTDAGRELRRTAEILHEEVEDLERRLAGHDQRPAGTVSVTYGDGFASEVVGAVARLGLQYPEIDVVHINTEDFVDVARREADIAVRVGDSPPDNFFGRRVGTVRWALYGAKSKYAEPEDDFVPADHYWVGFGGRWANAPPTKLLKDNIPEGRIRARIDDPQSIRELAAAGIGLGLLMCIDGDRDQRLTRVAPWPGDLPPTSLWLLLHPDMRRVHRVRVVVDYLFEHLRQVDGAFLDR
jgi:DNA-binding transcriptional LysR family regulator